MDPILHLVERSSGIVDPTLGSTDMSVCPLADPGGGATEAMASPKRQTREAKLCFGLPQTGQWAYLVGTESTDFTGFVT